MNDARNRRFVYLSSSVIPSRTANSVHIMKMCQAFAGNGFSVTLLAPDDPAIEPGINNVYEFYAVEKTFDLVKLPWLRIRGRGYIYGLSAALKAWRLKPELVYARFIPGCFFSMLFHIPVVYEAHSSIISAGRVCDFLFKRLLRSKYFKGLVVISEALRQYFLERYPLQPDQVHVAHDGADRCSGQTSDKIPLRSDRLNVGYIGHLYEGRGIDLILDLARRCPWADFHIVGGMEEDVEKWRAEGRGIENIIFHGFVPPSDVSKYGLSMDILLAPYQKKVAVQGGGDTSRWMSPLKLFEYMSYGKPILCSDLPVIREILTHDETALLCGPEEAQSWERALVQLSEDAALCKRLGEGANRVFLENYTWMARAKIISENVMK